MNNLEFVEILIREINRKPYYEIHYIINGSHHIGYSSFKIECISDMIREYFIPTDFDHLKKCTECGQEFPCIRSDFCPNCGSKMKIIERKDN